MNIPAPHGFSRSPVQEVSCYWTSSMHPRYLSVDTSPGTISYTELGRYTLSFRTPYPGWQAIAEKLADALHSVVEAKGTISRCSLSFTDRFMLSSGDEIRCLFSLSRFFPAIVEPDTSTKPHVCTIQLSSCTDTLAKITYFCDDGEKRVINIGFHLFSVSDTSIWAEDAISWFEAAHSEIHLLFDAIVTEKMMERLL